MSASPFPMSSSWATAWTMPNATATWPTSASCRESELQYRVPSTEYLAGALQLDQANLPCSVLSSQFSALSSRFPVLGTRYSKHGCYHRYNGFCSEQARKACAG